MRPSQQPPALRRTVRLILAFVKSLAEGSFGSVPVGMCTLLTEASSVYAGAIARRRLRSLTKGAFIMRGKSAWVKPARRVMVVSAIAWNATEIEKAADSMVSGLPGKIGSELNSPLAPVLPQP